MTSRRGLPIGLLLVVLATPATADAARIVVTTAADDATPNGNCTLREALLAANTDTFVDRCAAGDGHDTIILPAGHFLLTSTGPREDAGLTGDLDIRSVVTILGAGAGATVIDGGSLEWPDADRVFHVHAGHELRLSHLAGAAAPASSTGT